MNIGDPVKVINPDPAYLHHSYVGTVTGHTDDGWVVVQWDSPDEEGWIAEEFHPTELSSV